MPSARPRSWRPDQREASPVAPVGDLTFPAIERATLSNGVQVALARRGAVPTVLVSLNFDAGSAADSLDTPGTQSLMLGLLDEGTTTATRSPLPRSRDGLGARISAGAGQDPSSVTLSCRPVLSRNRPGDYSCIDVNGDFYILASFV